MATKRLRVFAGPNGSGKSTIKAVIPTNLLGFYLNPDEIENEVKHTSKFDTKLFSLQITQDEIVFFSNIILSSIVPKKAFLLTQLVVMLP